jgi:hypothetical protein
VTTEVKDWCRGKNWAIRLPVWLYLLYVGVRQFQQPVDFGNLFTAINLCIHEGGHILLRPFGNEVLHAAGGTLAQLAAPIASMAILWKDRDYFGLTFCLGWLSTNLIEVGVYMADARAQELPLVSAEGGDGVTQHDWNFLFGKFGLLPQDEAIGLATRELGTAVMIVALLTGAWLLLEMAFLRGEPSHFKAFPGQRGQRFRR